jgi:nicotinate dehydrogenase subunit B
VNPDGVRDQIEGAIQQSSSRTLYESVTFDQARITSVDWATYPMLHFHSVPDSIEVHIIDGPGLPFLGAGEVGQGPAAAAIANAVADATGQRLLTCLRRRPSSRRRSASEDSQIGIHRWSGI